MNRIAAINQRFDLMSRKPKKTAIGNGDETRNHCRTDQDGTNKGGALTGASGKSLGRKPKDPAGLGAGTGRSQGRHVGAAKGVDCDSKNKARKQIVPVGELIRFRLQGPPLSDKDYEGAEQLIEYTIGVFLAVGKSPWFNKAFPKSRDRDSLAHPAPLLVANILRSSQEFCRARKEILQSGKYSIGSRNEGVDEPALTFPGPYPFSFIPADFAEIRFPENVLSGIDYKGAEDLLSFLQDCLGKACYCPGFDKMFVRTKDRGPHCQPAPVLASNLVYHAEEFCRIRKERFKPSKRVKKTTGGRR